MVLAAANERNLAQAFEAFGRAPGGAVDASAPMVRLVSSVRVLNSVIHARLDADDSNRYIDETLAWFAARHASATWYVGPTTTPPDLGMRLEARGLTLAGAWAGMGRSLDDLPDAPPLPDGCSVAHVDDAAGLREAAQVVALGFGFPADLVPALAQLFLDLGAGQGRWRFYTARAGGAALAAAGLFLGTEVAGIYLVATVPEARRQGLGSALTVAAMREARLLGHGAAVLQSSPMGHTVYRRLGFEDHGAFRRYRWVPPTP